MRLNDTVAKGDTLADIDAGFRRYVANPKLHITLPWTEPAASPAPCYKNETLIRSPFSLSPNPMPNGC